jgi:hypothetical protein
MNIIFTCFAYESNSKTSSQVIFSNSQVTYIKNSFVALKTAKINNPNLRAIFFINFELDSGYKKQFQYNDIEVINVPFVDFLLPNKFKWKLAFYKLSCLKFLVFNIDFNKALLIDNDVINVYSLEPLFSEVKDNIMFYLLDHNIYHPDRILILNLYNELFDDGKLPLHLGGEFICGTRNSLTKFIEIAYSLYNKIKVSNFNIDVSHGDETITSITALLLGNKTYSSNYIYRYWTRRFYLTSTNYHYHKTPLWHLPQEKQTGLIFVYNDLLKYNRINVKKWSKFLGLPKINRPFSLKYLFSNLKRALNK